MFFLNKGILKEFLRILVILKEVLCFERNVQQPKSVAFFISTLELQMKNEKCTENEKPL